MANTLNNKIEVAWMALRENQPEGGQGRGNYRRQMTIGLAKEFDVDFERVRQRIAKIERRETGAPHCQTCTCGEVPDGD